MDKENISFLPYTVMFMSLRSCYVIMGHYVVHAVHTGDIKHLYMVILRFRDLAVMSLVLV